MAGGKETPRQKLINLMYLVLLALLALQVGAEIMVKFLQLNNSLTEFTMDSQDKSKAILGGIEAKVAERGNKPAEVEALKKAKEMHSLAQGTISYIEDLKQEMIQKTDGYLEDGTTPAGMKNTDITGQMFIGEGKGTKTGNAFEAKLDEFVTKANAYYADVQTALKEDKIEKSHYKSMTMDGKEDPQFSKDPEQRNKSFLQLAFDHTPMIAGLAFLTEKQSRVAAAEKEILDKLKQMVGSTDLKFDAVVAMATADAKVVAAGTKYKAQLFISATSSAAEEAKMWKDGKPIKVENGMGQIEFKASYGGGKPDKDGLIRKTWKGKIETQGQTIENTFEYYVAKPVLQVQSAAISNLYKNCGNELNITCPALGSTYNPVFIVTGANKKVGKGGKITVIPNKPKVSITVKSDGVSLGTLDFKVGLVPRPEIKAYAKGKEVDQKRGMKAPGPRSIQMKAVADESFARLLPKDARYRVTKWEAILVRGKRPVSKKTFSDPDGNLSAFASSARAGDRILIEVKEVRRMTYTGSTEAVSLGTIIMNIPLTD